MSIKQQKNKNVSEFDLMYKQLNNAQKQAVDSIEGPVMVIAGPGTGKTTILTLRIANILRKTDTAPENILALTFTESGTFAMRRKLLKIIGPAAYKVRIHTFHGFAEKVIEEYPDYFPRIIGSSVITDAEQLKIIEKIIQSPQISILRPYGDPLYYVKLILHEIHLLKRENVSPAMLAKSVKESVIPEDISHTDKTKLEKRDEKNAELAVVYEKYEAELRRQKFYDFDDMLLELIQAMQDDDDFKLILQETYQYILADEHQDANASQNRILELLADFHDSPNLFIVGDDKQAIYRFQGASLDNFLYFSKKYTAAKIIDLEHNYRSHQGILDASHSIIEKNPSIPGHKRKKLISLQIGHKPIHVYEFDSESDELDYVANILRRLISKGEKAEEIAVLYRENKEAQKISLALTANGVPNRIESDHNLLDDIDPSKIIILCRAINDLSNDELLGRVLLLPELNADAAKVSEMCRTASRTDTPLHSLISKSDDRQMKEILSRLNSWNKEASYIPFADFLQKIIADTGMLSGIVSSGDSLERLGSLQIFFDTVVRVAQSRKTFYLKDFIEYIDIIRDHGIMSKRSHIEHIEGVRLMTAHRSKGLEFNHVFIINATDGVWGNRSKRNHFSVPLVDHARDSGRIEDERRLFYVAVTRARESVVITYSKNRDDREVMPSQFISEVDEAHISFDKPIVATHSDIFVKKISPKILLPKTSILKSEFIKSKFLSQPFSVTHLNNYLKCPWHYFFVNLIRVPQAPTKHQMYGTAIHATLRSFFDAYKEDRDMSKKQLLDLFRHNLDKEALSSLERKEALEKGKTALEGYYSSYNPTWGRHLLTEFSLRGCEIDLGPKIDGKLELTGKLDKIEYIDDHNAIVIDFKTSKPKSRNELEGKTRDSDGNYKRQLVFYKLLSTDEKRFNMSYGEIDFVEPNERGKYKKERFEISEEEVKELRETIRNSAIEILNASFMDKFCKQKDCEYCRLGKILMKGEN